MTVFDDFQPLCHGIWREKYRFKEETSQVATLNRVFTAVSGRTTEQHRIFGALHELRLVPGGRVLAGAGTGRAVTLVNCYVMGTIPDDLAGIFEELKRSALTMQQGGGIGMDFSTLRPHGALVRGVDAAASGPLAFMDTWDAMCRTIMSAGTRRGAMMGILRVDHPDVLDFIEAKRTPGRLTMFNISVAVTDAFMQAVEADAEWPLCFDVPPYERSDTQLQETREGYVYKVVRARDVWNAITRATYDEAEPGVIFIDRVNERNNLAYRETIAATNPCGEQPLPPYGDCNLGAVNLARHVVDPWTADARVDFDLLRDTVRAGVRFLDDVIDVTAYPLPEQAAEAAATRRIGLGVMGLANLFQQLWVRYGSEASEMITRDVFLTIRDEAYRASAELAAERGRFPAYDDAIITAPTVRDLSSDVRERIRADGLRNGVLLTVAPTGTTAIFAGNVAGGIEPVYAHRYTRNVLLPDGTRESRPAYDWGYLEWCRKFKFDPVRYAINGQFKEYMVTHEDLTIEDHLRVMAMAQRFVDASISKTINVPTETPFEEFQEVYSRAHALGLKSVTTYRPNPASSRGAVLETSDEPKPVPELPAESVPLPSAREMLPSTPSSDRPEALPGVTYKIKRPDSDHAYYVTITDLAGRPHELFISTKEAIHSDWTAALGRMVSAIWRRGGDVGFVADELRQIHSPDGGFWLNGRRRPSIVAAIGDAIAQHGELATLSEEAKAVRNDELNQARLTVPHAPLPYWNNLTATKIIGTSADRCPRCQRHAVIYAEGCSTCVECGWSNCG